MRNSKKFKEIQRITVFALILLTKPSLGQTNDLVFENYTSCTIYIWADYYIQQSSNPCVPDCQGYSTTSRQSVGPISGMTPGTYTFLGSSVAPNSAWGTMYMEGSGGWNDHISYCGSGVSGNEDCSGNPILISFVSCGSGTTVVKID